MLRTHEPRRDARSALVVPLEARACVAPAEVGWKAARLARLIQEVTPQAGFRVPAGVAVTTAALLEHCARHRIRIDDEPEVVAAAIQNGDLSPRLSSELAEAAARLGDGPFAVRSSAIAEDDAGGSMAGLLETHLGVGAAQLGCRLRDCWTSLFSTRAQAYLNRPGASGRRPDLRMGVIVQRQLAPRWAGVLFTVDPTRRSGDTMVVEWVDGLGEALVSGRVSPSRLVLSRRAPHFPEGLPASLVRALEDLHAQALRAERLFGEPLDLEWCADDQGLHLLQARPVTAFGGTGMSAWSSANVGENYPAALSPFTWSVVDRFRSRYVESLAERLWVTESSRSALRPVFDNLLGVHRGRVHYNLSSWYRMFARLPGATLLRQAFDRYIDQPVPFGGPGGEPDLSSVPAWRIVPALIFRYVTLGRSVASFVRRFHRHRRQWRRELELAQSPAAAGRVLGQITGFLDEQWGDAALADFAAMVFPALLQAVARAWLPPDDAAHAPWLLRGIGLKSTEALKLVHALGAWVSTRPELLSLLKAGREAELVAALAGEGRVLWQTFLHEFGGRCYQELLLTSPTFEERPDLAWQLVRGVLAADAPDPAARETAEAEERGRWTRELIGRLPLWKRPLFARLVGDAQRAIAAREEVRLCQGLLYGELRRAALAVGRGLVERGRFDRPEDVFQLEADEVDRLLHGRFLYPETLPALIRSRREAGAAASADSRSLPSCFVLEDGRELEDPMDGAPGASAPHGERAWRGLGVSPGNVEGNVRVITDPVEQAGLLRPGEVLVARATDPGWTPLFLIASAAVVERGGMLSHAAIVAREVGLPVVVDVAGATSSLRDGERVRVDGNTGLVEIVGGGA
ncbi:MAG TPA: PEP/pyruvate-binding domain-containing protein [Myxococcaceae bacterium]|jgi:pyruvate,water dikinase